MTEELPPPAPCLNCGVEVSGNYCSNCGQERTTPIVPASHLLRDVVDEFFLVDAKLFRTLKPLITRPGFLTNEYIAGRRARYLSPFRLYFVISAFYFLAFSFAHYDVTVMRGLAYGLEQAHHAHVADKAPSAVMPTMDMPHNKRAAHEEQDLPHRHSAAPLPADSGHAGAGHSSLSDGMDRAQRHTVAVRLTTNWFLKNQSLITFFLVPIAALLLKLLYIRTRRLYIEHLVFAVHMQSFLFTVLLCALLPYARSVTYIAALALSAIYLYIAMRHVYRQRASTTLIRCGMMLASYGVIMAAAAYIAFLVFYYR